MFLNVLFFGGFFVILKVNIEFLKKFTSEPIVSTNKRDLEVLRDSQPKNFQ